VNGPQREGPLRDRSHGVLAVVVRLLPAGRRAWGRAMLAELAVVESAADRRRFVGGCVRVVVAQPAVLRAVYPPVLGVAAAVAVLVRTGDVGYAPLRWALLALVGVLLALSAWGRRPGILGPVAAAPSARAVRAGGQLLTAAAAAVVVVSADGRNDPGEQARADVPIFTVLLACYLAGLLALTAQRCVATARDLVVGGGAGVVAAALWLAFVLVVAPIPADVGAASVAAAVAAAGAALVDVRRRDGAHRAARALLAALCAGTVTLLFVFGAVVLLSTYGPASLIPDLVPAALTPADDLANSRIELQDPYVALLFLAGLTAAFLGVTGVVTRAPEQAAGQRPDTEQDPLAATAAL